MSDVRVSSSYCIASSRTITRCTCTSKTWYTPHCHILASDAFYQQRRTDCIVLVYYQERQYTTLSECTKQLTPHDTTDADSTALTQLVSMHRQDLVMRHLILASIEQAIPLIHSAHQYRHAHEPLSITAIPDDVIDAWLVCNPFAPQARETLVMQLNAWSASPLLEERFVDAMVASGKQQYQTVDSA
jgi:hypothetical protein